jgi:hypothetical protein
MRFYLAETGCPVDRVAPKYSARRAAGKKFRSEIRIVPETVRMSPWRGWGPVIALPLAVLLFTPPDGPRWLFMWLLAFAIFAGCKWLTWRRTPAGGAGWWQHAGYLLAWPGLDADAFLKPQRSAASDAPPAREWGFALFKCVVGAAFFWGGGRGVPAGWNILRGWLGMMGIILMLHFGLFHLLSCAWRTIGVEARPLMNNPLQSVGVGEFWGRRWNTAFRDLTHRFLFRPLAGKLGAPMALAAAFIVSGLLHDLVISVPAGGGYGGPTLFFAVQLVGLRAERSRLARAVCLRHGWRGRLFTLLVLVAPVYGLFHPPFVERVVVPFMRALGAA